MALKHNKGLIDDILLKSMPWKSWFIVEDNWNQSPLKMDCSHYPELNQRSIQVWIVVWCFDFHWSGKLLLQTIAKSPVLASGGKRLPLIQDSPLFIPDFRLKGQTSKGIWPGEAFAQNAAGNQQSKKSDLTANLIFSLLKGKKQ